MNKPLFTPPSWVFGPVWTILYILMGISVVMIIRSGFSKRKVKNALRLFSLQLILNLVWSPVFFGIHDVAGAFVIIVILWVLIYKTIEAFAEINKTASLLLYPYIIWVTIAALLNISILYLNR